MPDTHLLKSYQKGWWRDDPGDSIRVYYSDTNTISVDSRMSIDYARRRKDRAVMGVEICILLLSGVEFNKAVLPRWMMTKGFE